MNRDKLRGDTHQAHHVVDRYHESQISGCRLKIEVHFLAGSDWDLEPSILM